MIYVFYTQSLDDNLVQKDISFIPLSKVDFIPFDINCLNDYECYVFTSKNAVLSLKHQLDKTSKKLDFTKQVVCVGDTTKYYAQKLGFVNIKLPKKAYGKNLFDEYKDFFSLHKTLFLRGVKIASNPVNVDELIVYENKKIDFKKISFNKGDILAFTSPMMVRYFRAYYKNLDKDIKILAIGTSTKKALRFYKNDIYIPNETTMQGLLRLAFKIYGKKIRRK